VTYLITFSCYGSHNQGDPQGSVDRSHNRYGGPLVASNPKRRTAEIGLMDQPPYQLDHPRREAVMEAILSRSQDRGWCVLSAHVRSNHVHVVIDGDDESELVMTHLKSAASRRLNDLGFDDPTRKRWARHGSTRRLWDRDSVLKAIAYVIDQQGEPMSTFVADRSRTSRL
jgi:REP element-mobilizing transposase RayT